MTDIIAAAAAAVLTGKFGAIFVDKDGNAFDMDKDAEGNLQRVPFKQMYEGSPEAEEDQDQE